MQKKIIIIVLIALVIRFIHLNQSLWLDEAVVAKVVRTIPLHLIALRFSPADFHPPLYYLFMSVWTAVFGYSEISLRIPSLLFSIFTGYLVYKTGEELLGQKRAFWAMVFFLFNPLIVYYAQEARMYMMATLFLTTVFYFFVKIQCQKTNHNSHKNTLLLQTFSILSIFTFYGSIFFLAVLSIYSLIKRKYKLAFSLIVSVVFSFLILLPLLFKQMETAVIGLREVKNWSLVLGKANVKNLLLIPLKFSIGRISWTPKWTYYVTAVFWAMILGLFVVRSLHKQKMLGFICFFVLISVFLLSFLTPMLQYFRFLYLVPVFVLLISASLPNHRLVPFGIAVIFLIFTSVYLIYPQFHREDWRGLTQKLRRDIPVYMIYPSSDPVYYYRSDILVKEIRDIPRLNTLESRIQVIPYVVEVYGFNYKQALEAKGCMQVSVQSFRELILETWSCRNLAVLQ